MEQYELSPETSHLKAKKILTEDFYWNPTDESGPFGNDEGFDAFYGFKQWRLTNQEVSPLEYLKELFISWEYPSFDWNEMKPSKLKKYITAKTQVDNSVISDYLPSIMENMKRMSKNAGKEFDEEQIKQIVAGVTGNMGSTFLLGHDNAIIAVGFGQFVLEGKIDDDIRTLTKTAIKRELLPILIDRWDKNYIVTRTEQLNKMLVAIDKMNE